MCLHTPCSVAAAEKLSVKEEKLTKMTSFFSALCVFLFVFQGVEGQVKEDETVPIRCENPGTVFWLRLKDSAPGFEYIGTYSKSKGSGKVTDNAKFEVSENSLKVKGFKQLQDSGTYSCVTINNNELKFSGITTLHGEPVPTTTTTTTTKQTIRIQTVAVTPKHEEICKNFQGNIPRNLNVALGCELHIFIPLAAGCGLLLLLLVFTILYCNSIRTRRCPHHYKRQPRSRPAGHKTLPNPDY